jgi:type IV pilus assembly protein PilQ
LKALETQGKGRILSSPKVTNSDNKEVRIQSGRKFSYQRTSTDGTTIEFIDAELSLRVLPHVTFDKKVYMVFDAAKNVADLIGIFVTNTPNITTQETHAKVLLGSGDTTILGGIYQSNVVKNKKSVTFFSKIPILGNLFKSFNESDTITELLVFLTPTIVDNGYN